MKSLTASVIGVTTVCLVLLMIDGKSDPAPSQEHVRGADAQLKSRDSIHGSSMTHREGKSPAAAGPTALELSTLKWRNAQESAILNGVAPSQPAFHSVVDLSGLSGGGIAGSSVTFNVRDYRTNGDGERAVEYVQVPVIVVKNLVASPAVEAARKVANPVVAGTFDVEVRFRTSIHDWAQNIADAEETGDFPVIHETGIGLVYQSNLLSHITWGELATRTNSALPVADRWITAATVVTSSYADNLVAKLTP